MPRLSNILRSNRADARVAYAPVVIDALGGRWYLNDDDNRAFTKIRGSAERYRSEAAARSAAEAVQNLRGRHTRWRLYPWITDIDVERIENARM